MTNEEIELALHDQGRQQRCAARYEWIRLHFDAAQFLLACHLDDPKSLDGAIDEQIQQESQEARLPREDASADKIGATVHHIGTISFRICNNGHGVELVVDGHRCETMKAAESAFWQMVQDALIEHEEITRDEKLRFMSE